MTLSLEMCPGSRIEFLSHLPFLSISPDQLLSGSIMIKPLFGSLRVCYTFKTAQGAATKNMGHYPVTIFFWK